ncbi:11688_t:CDS:2 [Scutellospora calospora]|uniref:11688_t:CDS:1 n=1 Tax=Scutellospora calospora TaxID=85575 RepID=A0ACA9KV38_9GLOM|nr:11688_t:CDS:2 [Scutellospora calospora]
MPFCISYSHTLFSTEFIYEDKSYKTCARCMTNKAIKKDNLDEKTIIKAIFIQDISDYITNAIANLEYCLELSLIFHIQLDEITLGIVSTDVKAMTILIINEIENAAKAKVILKHKMIHKKSDDIAVSLEIKQEIERNLNLNLVDLQTHLHITQYTEVHCDATYKTAKGQFELYRIVGNIEGAG